MQFLSYSQTIIAGGACSLAALGIWVWIKNSREKSGRLFGLMALTFAYWITAPWVSEAGIKFWYFILAWTIIYAIIICFGPAVCLHASALIAEKPYRKRVRRFYAFSASMAVIMIFGIFISKFAWNVVLGSIILNTAVLIILLFYVLALFLILRDQHSHLFSGKSTDPNSYTGSILFSIFLSAGALQLAFGPVQIQGISAIVSFIFFMIALLAFVRFGFLGIKLMLLEGFFLIIIGASAILLFHASDTTEFWISLAAVSVIALYGRMAIIAVSKERTRSRKMETLNKQLQELDDARADFTAMVAHQLRGPIGGIRAAAASLADGLYGPLADKPKEAAVLIKNAAERLLGTAETYIQGIQLHQGTFVSQIVKTDVVGLIMETLNDLRPMAEVKKLPVVFEPHDLPPLLLVDKDVLANSLFNLIDNAVKYTDKGKVTVQASWHPNTLNIKVTDTGMGMTPADIKSAFNRFGRGKQSRVKQKEGTGLGLYIVRRLAQVAGGTIQALSAGKEMGSSFTLSMPAKRFDEP